MKPFLSLLLITMLLFPYLLSESFAQSQVTQVADSMKQAPIREDSISSFVIEGYVDAYFNFDFAEPAQYNRPYFVSYSRHNEFNINLAYVSLRYTTDRLRAVFTPGFGTYMNANYAAERVTLRNIVEANVGFRPFAGRASAWAKKIWIDAGVLPSPYSCENIIAIDQIAHSRSMCAENVPYYLSGAKITLPVTTKNTGYLYLINGWQSIEDINSPLAMGTQLEIKPSSALAINWNTYMGNEQSPSAPQNRMRYFTDVYVSYNADSTWRWSAGAYIGAQQRSLAAGGREYVPWYQATIVAQYALTSKHAVYGRAEYFRDAHQVLLVPVTNAAYFDALSTTLGYTLHITPQASFRLEGRSFFSSNPVFIRAEKAQVSTNATILGALVMRFVR